MSAIGQEIAKAGWLYRQSSVLHRWKRNWFALYRDGLLRYFESPDSTRAEEVFIIRAVCRGITAGAEVKATNPPEEVRSGKTCMFELKMRDGNHLLLCADTEDDMMAWQFALEDARTMAPSGGLPGAVPMGYTYQNVVLGYGGYPGQILSTSTQSSAQVIQSPQGSTTIINQPPQMVIMDNPYYCHRRHPYGVQGGTVYVTRPRYW